MKEVYKASSPGCTQVSNDVIVPFSSRTTTGLYRFVLLLCFAVLGQIAASAQGPCPPGGCTITCPPDISLCLATANYGASEITPAWVASHTSSSTPNCSRTRVWLDNMGMQELTQPITVDCDDVNEHVDLWVSREVPLNPGCRSSLVRVRVHIKDCEPPAVACPPMAMYVCNDDVARPGSFLPFPLSLFWPGYRVINQATFQSLGGSASDACGLDGVFYKDEIIAVDPVCKTNRTIRRDFVIFDVNGNYKTCSQEIVVADNVPPVFTSSPADLTLACDITPTSFNAAVTAWLNANTDPGNQAGPDAVVVDGCDENMVMITAVPGNPGTIWNQMPAACDPNPREVTVVFTANDGCGNLTTRSARVILRDFVPPTVPPIATSYYSCADDVPPAPNTEVVIGENDNCTPAEKLTVELIDTDVTPGGCPNRFVMERTYRISDCDGRSVLRTHRIEVDDEDNPYWNPGAVNKVLYNVCNPDTLLAEIQTWLNANGNGIAYDECGTPAVSANKTAAQIRSEILNFCPPTNPVRNFRGSEVTFTATDACGNTSTSRAIFRLYDTEAPTGIAPADITYSCVSNVPAMTAAMVTNLADNCTSGATVVVTVESNPTFYPGCEDDPFAAYRRWRLTDCAGNFRIVEQKITIQDETAPVWGPGAISLTVDCDDPTKGTQIAQWLNNRGGVNATDNCGEAVIYSYSPGSVNAVLNALGACAPISGSATVTFSATDVCGNVSTKTGVVTVVDDEAPTATAQEDMYACEDDVPAPNTAVIIDEEDECDPTVDVTFLPNATQNNGGTACPNSPLVITRWYELKDCAGNTSSVSHQITVMDMTAPQAIAQSLTRYLDEDCNITVDADEFDNGSFDNCGIKKIEIRRGSSGPWASALTFTGLDIPNIPNCGAFVENSAIITIQVRVTDNCDQSDITTTTITVIDNTPPTIDCPADFTAYTSSNGNGDCTATALWNHPVPSDNCAVGCFTMEVQKEINGVFVTINPDNGFPTPNYQIDVLGQQGQPVAYEFAKGPYCDDNQYKIIYRVRDVHGNTKPEVSCSFIITISDDEAPEWNNCPEQPIVAQVVTGDCYQMKCYTRPIPYDNCQDPTGPCPPPTVVVTVSDPTVMINQVGDEDCALFPVGTTYVYYTATDYEGNVSTCTVTVEISDDQAPVAMCATPFTVNMEPDGSMEISIAQIDAPGTEDNCGICYKGISRDPNCGDEECFGPTVTLTCADVNTTVEITMKVVDCSVPGNEATCTALVTVQDMQSPGIASCPSDITVGTDNNVCNAVATYSAPLFNDGCGSPHTGTLVEGLASGSIFPIGVTEVVYSYTSASGYTVYCNFNVTVEDDQNPTIVCPAPVTNLTCTQSLPAPLVATAFSGGTLTDNCGVSTLEFSDYDNGLSSCPNDGARVVVRTYRAFDAAGNSASCSQSFTYLEDTDAPVFNVPSLAPVAGTCATDVPAIPTITATDGSGCGGVTIDFEETITSLSGSGDPVCANKFIVTRTWVASDICNNQRTLVQVITINDNVAPVLASKPADMNLQCASAVPAAPSIGATDNCGVVTVDFTETTDPGACPNAFVMRRTWLATDACGNTDVHTQTITVNDNTNPVLSVRPANAFVSCSEDVPPAVVVTATDNCGVVTVDFSETTNSFGCPNKYQVIRRWVATDACGNQDKHTQVITVNDNVAPTWNQPLLNPFVFGDCADDVPPVPFFTASDNCGAPIDVEFNETIDPGLCPNSFTLRRTWSAEDDCGNFTFRVQTIVIEDNVAPTLYATPLNINQLKCIDDVPLAPYQFAYDNCDIAFLDFSEYVEMGDCINDVLIVRRWVATDLCGNETVHEQNIRVKDDVAPVLAVTPLNLNQFECMDEVPLAPYQSATDNCGIVNVDFSEYMDMGDCINDVLIVRRWVATDACGNTDVHEQNIRVLDNVPPFLPVKPLDLQVTCSEDIPAVPVQNALDNCNIVYLDFSEEVQPGGCENQYVVVRTWVATDACGNVKSHQQYITVNDQIAPVLAVTPLDVTVSCGELVPPVPEQSATDNCDAPVILDFSEVIDDNGCENRYTVIRTWRATDLCGNATVHTWTITVNDNVAPTLSVRPLDISVECSEQVPAVPVQTATDNCVSPVDLEFTEVEVPGTCPNQYQIVRTWTAEDACGNSTFHIWTITVNDTKAPVWTSAAPSNLTLQCGEAVPAAPVQTASDNCAAPVDIELSETWLPGAGPNDGNVLVRTWTAEDDCGNATTRVQTITINDTQAPVLANLPAATVNVECSEQVPAVAAVTASDNCQGTIDVEFVEVEVPGTCPNQYQVVRTWTAVDFAGNSTIFVQTITVSDTKAPVWTSALPGDLTLQCGEAVPAAATLTASDNCAAPIDIELSETWLPGAGPNDGNILVRTWTAQDDCGNATTHVQTITINDVIAPVLANLPAATVNVECSEQVPAVAAVTASDNCQGTLDVEFFEVEVPGTCPNQYSVVRTWTAVDFAGNSTIFVQTINVNDTKAPVWTSALPGNLTLQCGETVPAAATLTASDNCAAPVDIELSETWLPGAGPNDGNVLVRTWTAEDDCGNATTHVQTITINDVTAPVLANLPDAVVNVECSEQVPAVAAVTASDNCQGTLDVEFFEVEVPGTCPNQYSVVRTWTAVDFAGNSTIFVQVIGVNDTKAPVWTSPAPANLTLQCGEAVPAAVPQTATDNCNAPVDIELSETWLPGAGPNDGNVLVRTWTAEDDCGNATTRVQTITVNDVIAPVLANLPPATVNVECSEQVPAVAAVTASDNCQGTLDVDFFEVEIPGTCPNQYSVTRTWTAVDFAGNSTIFVQTINVSDTKAPVWTSALPDNLTLQCGEAVPAAAVLTATDNCNAPVDIELSETWLPGAGPNDGNVLVRTWTAEDDCGNATTHVQTITVNDAVAPVLANLPDAVVNVSCSENVPAVAAVTVSDNCQGTVDLEFTEVEVPGTCPNQYSVVRTWTAVDFAGNSTFFVQTINVSDVVAPVFNAPLPSDFTLQCGETVPAAPVLTATDNCNAPVDVEFNETYLPGAGPNDNATIVRTWTAEDDCGNATSFVQTITINDVVAPVLSGLPTAVVNVSCANDVPAVVVVTASDNCQGTVDVDFSEVQQPGSCANNFTVVRTWTAVDFAGNSTFFVQTINVNDNVAPIVSCPAPQTAQCNVDEVTVYANLNEFILAGGSASDNCGLVVNDFGMISQTSVGNVFTRVYEVTDECGNNATCAQTITILDTQAPVFLNCPTGPLVFGNDPDKCSAKINWGIPVAVDNCVIPTVVQISGPTVGSIVAVGNYTVVYRATDAAGNTAICSFAVQVMDTQAPEFDADITMPNDTTVQCNAIPSNCVYHGPLICTPLTNADVNDNCGTATVSFSETSTQCTNQAQCCFYNYTITRRWTITDAAGNTRQHVQVITVVDTTKPTAICKNFTLTLDKFGVATLTPADINNGSFDNCAAPQFLTYTLSKTSFNCSNLGANTVTLTVTDPCGNFSTCTAIVTVVEGIGSCTPQFNVATSCKDNATNLDNGQFVDLITVKALAGQTWTITGNTGLFNVNSPNPPAAPTALPVGTQLIMGSADGINNDGDGQTDEADEMIYYTIRGVHVDGIGYNIGLSNNIGQTATISNKAYYPTPIFLNLDGPFCLSTPPFTIQVGELYGAAGVVTSIKVNGVATNTFNAALLGIGFHTVEATFDAGAATTNLVINGVLVGGTNDQAIADPGCKQTITKSVQIIGTPTTVACNDVINVSLDADCEEVITPDMVLEGSYFCYDDYSVIITYPAGTTSFNPPNKVNASHIGKTIMFSLRHIISGNLCWGTIVVEDKLAPEISCPDNTTILCTQSEDNLSLTGQPTVDDCSAFSVVREDQYQQFSCAQNNVVFTSVSRLWVATDAWGNKDSCTQTIDILRGTVDQVNFPTDVEYVCTNVPASLQPGTTGWPTIAGVNLTTNGTGACGLSVSFSDELATICPGSYKIIRTWKINDWCSPGTGGPSNREHIQYIKVTDVPPTVDFSNFTYDADNDWYVINTNAIINGQCVSAGPIPTAIFNGVCNQVVDVKVTTPLGPITNGGLLPQPGLGLGLHNITYVLTDECGNITSITIKVNVIDNTPPAVSCDEFTQVALGGSGLSEVFAETFDDGTYDNCCLDGFLVRRMVDGPCDNDDVEDDFADRVVFCCEDINDTVMVVLRAFDCHGNYNDCMVSVFVEDKIKPVCTSPANVTVSCENFDPSLWAYGAATAADNCCIDTITTTVNYALFDTLCNKGTITRTFRAFDCAGQSSQCSQRIFVQYEQDYYVRFPNDVIVTDCNGSGNYGQPTFFGEDCELLAVSFTDETFTVVPDACLKIERTWHVINWCTFNPNAPLITVPNPNPNSIANHPSNLPGPIVSPVQTPGDPWKSTIIAILPGQTPTNYSIYWDANANGYSYKQIIKIIDTEAPIFADCPASPVTINDLSPNDPLLWNEMYYWDGSNNSHDLCESTTDLSVTLTDSCGGNNVSVKYLLFLDLDNDGDMETVVSSTNIPPANTVFFGNANNPNFTGGTAYNFDNRPVPLNQKYRFNIDVVRNGNDATAKLIWDTPQQQANLNDNTMQGVAPQLPYGTHKIKWIANDGCGNEAVCEYTIVVKDGKAPTVVCINGLSVNIMPTGMITLWGSDFLQYTEDNCTPAGLIDLSIVESDESTGVFPVDAQGNPITNVNFDCQEVGTQLVQLWGRDVAGNADYCETYVIVQDPNNFCTSQPVTVAGDLKTEAQNGLEEASVELVGSHPALPPVSMFDMSDNSGAYEFSNALPIASNYSVTPLKDDNHLNGVTTYDLVLISKHILGLEPLASPYKMIAADANKSNSITTFDIVELRKLILGIYSELPNNTSWRFVDKSFNFADPNNPFAVQFPEFKSVADVQASQMNDDFVSLKVGDVNGSAIANSLMSADDRTSGSLLFDVEDRTVKAGEEFTVNFTAAEQVVGYQFTMNLKGLEVVDIVPGNGMKLDNFAVFADAITTSFDGKEKGAFTVKFRATTNGQLSNLLGVSSRITKAEAYKNDARLDVAFRFNGTTIAGVGFELYQNTPNPFISKTMIGFHLPEATEATLTIFDEAGRMIFTQTGDFGKGYNAITLDRDMVNTTGILYYKVETATDSATKKMIQTK